MPSTPGTARHRLRRWLFAVVAAAVLLAFLGYAVRTPLLQAVGAQLVHVDELVRSDAIVILAGGVPEREIAAADLFKNGWASRVIITAEPPRPALEALRRRGVTVPSDLDLRVLYLTQLGVPRPSITVLPGYVESTEQEARSIRRWVDEQRARQVIFVTSTYHTARARLVLRKSLPEGLVIRMHGATADEFDVDGWWRNRTMLRNGVFEWQKLVLYRVRSCCS